MNIQDKTIAQLRKMPDALVQEVSDFMTKLLKNEFQEFCDQVGKNAEAKGMTEEKLKEILESDD